MSRAPERVRYRRARRVLNRAHVVGGERVDGVGRPGLVAPRVAGLLRPGGRLLVVYHPAAFVEILRVQQPLPRRVHELLVTHVLAAVGVGEFEHLGEPLVDLDRLPVVLAEVERFEQREDLSDRQPAGARQRLGSDRDVAVLDVLRGVDRDVVRAEVGGGHAPAVLLDGLGERLADLPFVDSADALVGDRLERRREVWLDEVVADVERLAAGGEHRAGGVVEFTILFGDRASEVVVDPGSVGEVDGGLDQLFDLAGTETLQRDVARFERSGDSNRLTEGDARLERDRFAVVEEHIGRRTEGCALAVVDRVEFVLLGVVDHHEPAAAEARGVGLDGVERELDRDRRIDRVAARVEHVGAGRDRPRVARRDHPVATGGRVDPLDPLAFVVPRGRAAGAHRECPRPECDGRSLQKRSSVASRSGFRLPIREFARW